MSTTATTPSLSSGQGQAIADFSFYIGYRVLPQATQWTMGDDEPIYRGHMVQETGLPGSATKADRSQIGQFKARSEELTARGLPPWVGPRDTASHESEVLRSSWTLRQWADNYCQSRATFKEFVYEKARQRRVCNTKFNTPDTRVYNTGRLRVEPQRAPRCDRRCYSIHGLPRRGVHQL
jgi:hypothetical protein